MSIASIAGSIIGPAMTIVASIVGDMILAKWVTAFHVWYRRHAWHALKIRVDDDFQKLEREWNNFQQDRP